MNSSDLVIVVMMFSRDLVMILSSVDPYSLYRLAYMFSSLSLYELAYTG